MTRGAPAVLSNLPQSAMWKVPGWGVGGPGQPQVPRLTVASSFGGVSRFPARAAHLKAAATHAQASKGRWGGDGCACPEHKQ